MIDNPYYVWYNTRDSKDRHINPDVIMRSYPSGPPKNARKNFRAFFGGPDSWKSIITKTAK